MLSVMGILFALGLLYGIAQFKKYEPGAQCGIGVFSLLVFSYAETLFDLGVASPISLYIIPNTHRENSTDFFLPSAATLSNSHAKSPLTRYMRLDIS